MPIRRYSDPINVKRIWDAIRSANQMRQVADISKISKYFQNIDDCTHVQAELYIKQTLKDQLITYVYYLKNISNTYTRTIVYINYKF